MSSSNTMGSSTITIDRNSRHVTKAMKLVGVSGGVPAPRPQKVRSKLSEHQKDQFLKQGSRLGVRASDWILADPNNGDHKALANVISEQPGEVKKYNIYWTDKAATPPYKYLVKVAELASHGKCGESLAVEEYGRTAKEAAQACKDVLDDKEPVVHFVTYEDEVHKN